MQPPDSSSPAPEEPDVHVRFTDIRDAARPKVIADYRVNRAAAKNFLDDWARHHSPDLVVRIVTDDCVDFKRMICEGLYRWL
ncbi:hypothetical protein [Nocardia sp. NBC_01388]|uniref:hypothetical protein n=1 Tax=Nocardia sp. NBC_01388 TaxID=2903596 RepID=UPI0032551623